MKQRYYQLIGFILILSSSFFSSAQCPEITCPTNININNDSGECGAVVNFTPPQGTDPCGSGSVTFSNCGATGRLGPTQGQVNSAYSGGPLDGQVAINTQGIQEWVVPNTGTYTVEVAGAQGANNNGIVGEGAIIIGEFNLTSGDNLLIAVGQQSVYTGTQQWQGGSGGTFVALGPQINTCTPLVVAGGGGTNRSTSLYSTIMRANTGTSGKNGSGTLGGLDGNAAQPGGMNSNSGGGAAGFYQNGLSQTDRRSLCPSAPNPFPPSEAFVNGATGGYFTTGYDNCNVSFHGGFGSGGPGGWGGSGGGGGYSGGGNCSNNGYSGGGGSFIHQTAITASTSDGLFTTTGNEPDLTYNGVVNNLNQWWTSGNGYVTITWSGSTATTTQTAGLASGSLFPIGITTQTYEAVDGFGNTVTCSFTVEVVDSENPTITAPVAVSIGTDLSSCEATGVALGTPVTADNCSVNTVTNDAPTSFPTGVTTVTWTVTDNSGNTAQATQTVTVTDSENPTITAPVAVSIGTDLSSCEATGVALGTPVTADNCSVNTVTNDAPTSFPTGVTTVTWTVTDNSGNTAQATQTVTVTDDENPTITAPVAVSIGTDLSSCEATGVALGTPVTADNCSVNTVTNDAPTSFPTGVTTVTWTVTDNAGNSAQATQTVTVTDDENPTITAPVAVSIGTDVSSCEATGVALGTPVTADNCSVNTVTNDAPTSFPTGATTVTWTVTDNSGNTAQATQTVTVTDDENPTITAPSALTQSADASSCEATGVVLGAPVTADNCSVNTVTNDAPTTFPTGVTTVTWTVTDNAGNSAQATQTVTVTDDENPVIVGCPSNISTTPNIANCESTVTWTVPTATDNCTTTLTETISHNSGDAFGVGVTNVTYEYSDASGNTSTCAFTVEVLDDLDVTLTGTDATCHGDESGGVTTDVTGGNGPYSYDWTDGLGFSSTDEDLVNVGSGTYDLTVTDASGCMAMSQVVISEPAAIQGTTVSTNITNGNDGTVDLSVTGGTPSYTFSWEGPGGFTSTDQNLTGLDDPGVYTVTITDANGCEVEEDVFVESNVGLSSHSISVVNVYPNPNNGMFTIDFGGLKEEVTIRVMDAQGRIVKHERFTSTDKAGLELDAQKGIYTLLINIDGELVNKRISLQ